MTQQLFATAPSASSGLNGLLTGLVDGVRNSVVQVRVGRAGAGAGIIWTADGQILTNHHVVAAAQGQLKVLFNDGRAFDATLISSDPTLDLALIKIEATNLPAVTVGDSASLRVGELVVAIGHPWGQRDVVTAGIVSGLGTARAPGSSFSTSYIRSDVLLRPGNSGGPLFNAAGQVVGINAMVFGGDLGVAIPAHVAQKWLAKLAQPRTPISLGLEVKPVKLMVATGNRRWRREVEGLAVNRVIAGGTGDLAGVKAGDVLLGVGGRRVPDKAALLEALRQPFINLTLQVLRGDSVVMLETALDGLKQTA